MKRLSLKIETFPLEERKLREALAWCKTSKPSTKREHEWLAGRYCAKKAMEEAGVFWSKPLEVFERMPVWPAGVKGSITHAGNIAVAIAGKDLSAAGIDCEFLMDKNRARERRRYFMRKEEELLADSSPEIAPTLIFSAKEALFKCLYPKCLSYFGMLEAKLTAFGDEFFEIELDSERPELANVRGPHKGAYQIFNDKIIAWVLKDKQ